MVGVDRGATASGAFDVDWGSTKRVCGVINSHSSQALHEQTDRLKMELGYVSFAEYSSEFPMRHILEDSV